MSGRRNRVVDRTPPKIVVPPDKETIFTRAGKATMNKILDHFEAEPLKRGYLVRKKKQ